MEARNDRETPARVHLRIPFHKDDGSIVWSNNVQVVPMRANSVAELVLHWMKQEIPMQMVKNCLATCTTGSFVVLLSESLLNLSNNACTLRDNDHLVFRAADKDEMQLYGGSPYLLPASQVRQSTATPTGSRSASGHGHKSTHASSEAQSSGSPAGVGNSGTVVSSSDSNSSSDSSDSSDSDSSSSSSSGSSSDSDSSSSDSHCSKQQLPPQKPDLVAAVQQPAADRRPPPSQPADADGLGCVAALDLSSAVLAALASDWAPVDWNGANGRGKKRSRSGVSSQGATVRGVTARLPHATSRVLSAQEVEGRSVACGDDFVPSVGDVLQLHVLATGVQPNSFCPTAAEGSSAEQEVSASEGMLDFGAMQAALATPEVLLCRVVQVFSEQGVLRVCCGVAHTSAGEGSPLQWADAAASISRDGKSDIGAAANLCVQLDSIISARVALGPSFALALIKQKREAKAFLQQLASKSAKQSPAAQATSGRASHGQASAAVTPPIDGAQAEQAASGETQPRSNKRRRHSKRYHKVVAQRALGVGSFLAALNKK